jgi:hypothetical protein
MGGYQKIFKYQTLRNVRAFVQSSKRLVLFSYFPNSATQAILKHHCSIIAASLQHSLMQPMKTPK